MAIKPSEVKVFDTKCLLNHLETHIDAILTTNVGNNKFGTKFPTYFNLAYETRTDSKLANELVERYCAVGWKVFVEGAGVKMGNTDTMEYKLLFYEPDKNNEMIIED